MVPNPLPETRNCPPDPAVTVPSTGGGGNSVTVTGADFDGSATLTAVSVTVYGAEIAEGAV